MDLNRYFYSNLLLSNAVTKFLFSIIYDQKYLTKFSRFIKNISRNLTKSHKIFLMNQKYFTVQCCDEISLFYNIRSKISHEISRNLTIHQKYLTKSHEISRNIFDSSKIFSIIYDQKYLTKSHEISRNFHDSSKISHEIFTIHQKSENIFNLTVQCCGRISLITIHLKNLKIFSTLLSNAVVEFLFHNRQKISKNLKNISQSKSQKI